MKEYIEIVNDNLIYHKSDGTVIKLLPTIEDIMSADSVDRPQGKWLGYEVPSECSVCGHHWDEYVFGQELWHDGSVPNYCPNCGARMKGADDDGKRD